MSYRSPSLFPPVSIELTFFLRLHTRTLTGTMDNTQAKGVMKKGHTFTIEPMITLGTWQDEVHSAFSCDLWLFLSPNSVFLYSSICGASCPSLLSAFLLTHPNTSLGSAAFSKTWPDNWTAVTVDGKRSAQFEHTMVVTDTGVEILTAREGEPRDCLRPYDPSVWQRDGVKEEEK